MNATGIRHVVVLVQENQSFDRMLGWVTLPDPKQKLEGLTGNETNPLSPASPGETVKVGRTSSPEVRRT